jgi:hypothetical protein
MNLPGILATVFPFPLFLTMLKYRHEIRHSTFSETHFRHVETGARKRKVVVSTRR